VTALVLDARRRRTRDALLSPPVEALLFGLIAFFAYWLTGPAAGGDMWPPLAEAFLQGQLHLADDRPWLELIGIAVHAYGIWVINVLGFVA